MPKEIKSNADLAGVQAGEVVSLHGRKYVYLGELMTKTCGCPSCVNIVPIPHLLYFDEKYKCITIMRVGTIEDSQPKKITNVMIAEPVGPEDDRFVEFSALLCRAGLLPH